MSTVKSKKLQVGTDASASNNFTIYQPATPDGTLRIGVGNADSPTEVARFDATGMISGGATPNALSTASGSAPSYSARAWVNFNGQGTISIRASQNVSSLTDEGVGNFAVNMTTAMPDVNYSIVVGGSYYPNPQTAQGNAIFSGGVNTSTFRIGANHFGTGKHDTELIYAAVFR